MCYFGKNTPILALASVMVASVLAGSAFGQMRTFGTKHRGPLPPALTGQRSNANSPGALRLPSYNVTPNRPSVPGNRPPSRPGGGNSGGGWNRPGHGSGNHGDHDHGHNHGGKYPWYKDRSRYPYYSYPSSSIYYLPYASYGVTTPYYYDSGYDANYAATQAEIDQLRQQNELLRQQNNQLQNPAANIRLADRAKVRYQQSMETATRLFELGSYGRAADRFEEAARYQPDDATPRFLRAQALFASGQYEEAAREVKAGLKINPNWLGVNFDLKSMYQDPDDHMRQMARLANRLAANPLDRESLFLLGFELYFSGEKDKALALLRQAEKLEPDAEHLKLFLDFAPLNP